VKKNYFFIGRFLTYPATTVILNTIVSREDRTALKKIHKSNKKRQAKVDHTKLFNVFFKSSVEFRDNPFEKVGERNCPTEGAEFP
jgi:hypothetical protein